MAYLDQQHTHKRLAGASGVALIHIALAFGLATGLTITYTGVEEDGPLVGTTVHLDPPPPVDDTEPTPETSVVTSTPQPPVAPDTVFDLKPQVPDIVISEIPLGPTIPLGDITLIPGPVGPPQPPALAPRAPSPTNGPTGWVTTNDYPPARPAARLGR